MNREIKFRMWNNCEDKTKSKMFYDSNNVMNCLMQQIDYNNKDFGYNHIEDGNSFMQFTGLKDKNGFDIYEGDIVKYSDNHVENTIYEIPKLRDCFITNQIGYELENRKDAYCEIIGNIYENLELIK